MTVKRTHKDYLVELKVANPKVRCLSKYEGGHTAILHKCLECKHEWNVSPTSLIRTKSGCPECGKAQRGRSCRSTHTDIVKRLKKLSPDLELLEEYVHGNHPIDHKHLLCGHVWKARPANTLKGRGCPKCKLRMKEVKLGKRNVLVRGYEKQAVEWLLSNGHSAKDLHVHNEKTVPNFSYVFRGSDRRYFPDLFLPKRKAIIEVKSWSTLGLIGNMYQSKPGELYSMTVAKGKAVEAEGYKFVLMLMNEDGSRVKLPKNWMTLSRKQLLASLRIRV